RIADAQRGDPPSRGRSHRRHQHVPPPVNNTEEPARHFLELVVGGDLVSLASPWRETARGDAKEAWIGVRLAKIFSADPPLATANQNGRSRTRRQGAALCGRPSFPRRGAPTDCKGEPEFL